MIYKIAHKLPSLGVIVQMSTLGLYPMSYYGRVENGGAVDVLGTDKNKEPDSLQIWLPIPSSAYQEATYMRHP